MFADLALKFNEGGIFMWILLGVLGISIALFFERLHFYFTTCKEVSPRIAATAAKTLLNDEVATEIVKLSEAKDPLSPLIAVALERASQKNTIAHIQDGIDEEALVQLPRLTERLNYLALIANVATLLGLLGTIAGLQDAFSSLATVEATEKAAMLAAGISKAMNTTAFGLLVAIPSMVAYTYLTNKQKRLTSQIDDAMLRLVNFIKNEHLSA